MGFGILFIGYFLLLNVTRFAFTDLIAALVMALAFYKLSAVEKTFKNALFFSYFLIPVGTAELVLELWQMFDPLIEESFALIISILSIIRHLMVAATTVGALTGIKSLAGEVGLPDLKRKCRFMIPTTMAVYLLLALMNVYGIEFIGMQVVATLALIALLASFIAVIYTLVLIYSAYMHICMPEDNEDIPAKPSKFGFVNKFREHTEKRNAEYAEYKLTKLKKKGDKKKKK